MKFLYLIAVICCTKVTISPVTDRLIALSYSRRSPHTFTFDFVGKSRITHTIRNCMIPLIVPLSNGTHRFYFCGQLMCLTDYGLATCDIPEENSEFTIKVKDDKFLISKYGFCLHHTDGNIFFRDCNENSAYQLFYIDRFFAPKGDNSDLTAYARELGKGSRVHLADAAFREFSKIRQAEYIRDLFDNEAKYELKFSNEQDERTNVQN
ncbi:hypothetical protein NBO_462g0003 [Nosema bombycis CQ1]|uniref:Uncharacterized protein n=1 Tax=Nosema bombycis (strain CQ1 / CVCC 102059) TaxID=578461 RepID=R0M2U1_NOSB1|nr:hypothetical protein NBO_462g0003 [Nosema bombycis CQ1]|eukprot:EOB12334.1 hypothetical protein NBO_462g0003 [Nosema bombycis CQ1]